MAAASALGRGARRLADELADALGVEVAYAFLAFAHRDRSDPRPPARSPGSGAAPEPRLPEPPPPVEASRRPTRARRWQGPYLELALANLPEIAKPKVQPKRLSTGQAPLEIAQVESGWRHQLHRVRRVVAPVQFRWQVLDETVDCRCD